MTYLRNPHSRSTSEGSFFPNIKASLAFAAPTKTHVNQNHVELTKEDLLRLVNDTLEPPSVTIPECKLRLVAN